MNAARELFEDITQLPEYYPTRAETEILTQRGAQFAELIGPGRAVVEFGSGSSVKTPLLLSAIAPGAYVPLDISGDFLRAAAADLAAKFPGLPVHPVEADFTKRVQLPREVADLPKLGFFPGSTIGNMVPRTAVDLLREMRATLGDGSLLLIGMDLIKDRKVLEAAYDDAAGVTAAFNRNLITPHQPRTFAARSPKTRSATKRAGWISTPGLKCIWWPAATCVSQFRAGSSPCKLANRSTPKTATSSASVAATCCCSRGTGLR